MTDDDRGWNTFAVGLAAGAFLVFLIVAGLVYIVGPTEAACAVCP